jgi:hypothetical protein
MRLLAASQSVYPRRGAQLCLQSTLISTFPLTLQTLSLPATTSDESETSIADAVEDSLLGILGEGSEITDITLSKHGRRLLSMVGLTYTVTNINGMTAKVVIQMLQDSMDNGNFASALSSNSGVTVEGVSNLQTVNVSPTSAPTNPPPQKNAGSSYPILVSKSMHISQLCDQFIRLHAICPSVCLSVCVFTYL